MAYGFEPEFGFGEDLAPGLDSLFMEGVPGEDDGGLAPPDPGGNHLSATRDQVDAGEVLRG